MAFICNIYIIIIIRKYVLKRLKKCLSLDETG